jgi:hypothetical protein
MVGWMMMEQLKERMQKEGTTNEREMIEKMGREREKERLQNEEWLASLSLKGD